MKKRAIISLLCFLLAFTPAFAEDALTEVSAEPTAAVENVETVENAETTEAAETEETAEAAETEETSETAEVSEAAAEPIAAEEEADAEPERTRILIYQGPDKDGVPQNELAVLTAVPDLAFDYVIFYDQAHLSICDLTAATAYEERQACFLEWIDVVGSHRARNVVHATPWKVLLQDDTALVPSLTDVVWVTCYDAAPEDIPDLSAEISQLVACGGTLHVLDASGGAELKTAFAAFANTQVTHVDTTTFHVVDLLLKEAGYHYVNHDLTAAMIRRSEVHPLNGIMGQSLLMESTPYYHLVGSAAAYRELSFSYASSAQGVAIVPSDPAEVEPQEEQPSVDGEFPLVNTHAHYATTTAGDEAAQPAEEPVAEEPVDELTQLLNHLISTYQVCWYFKPVDELTITAQVEPAAIPHGIDEQVTVRMTLSAEQHHLFENGLCTADLTDASGAYQLSAVLAGEQDQVYETSVVYAQEPGVYDITFDRPEAGNYTLQANIQWSGMDYSFAALECPLAVEAPSPVSARPQTAIRLMVSPLLWHNEESTALLKGSTLFNGSFEPVQCMTAHDEHVQVERDAKGFRLTAVKEGQTSLLFLAGDKVSQAAVQVQVINGQKLVIAEAIALLALALLLLCLVLFTRSHRPRFRRNEVLRVEIDSDHTVTVPLKKYSASGVTLWRLMVIGGCAKDYSQDSNYLKQVRLLPKLDQIVIRNQKIKEEMSANKAHTLRSDSHTYVITLETQE